MGLFSFVKEAGEKLFGGSQAHAAPAPAASPAAAAPSQQDLNARAGKAIKTYIASQNLGVRDVRVQLPGQPEGKVTVAGTAPTQAVKEKVTLCCGNVASVTERGQPDERDQPRARSPVPRCGQRRHAVRHRQEVLRRRQQVQRDLRGQHAPCSALPNKIYPGQKLRIPAL